jgi:Serine dehydrogenase proteinase
VFLNTPGGSAETVEKLVEIIRFHYEEVFFVVPDEAMSAGTIFCMSGDRIYMDYTSSLGPIDPQVHNGKDWVPALGYLDQVERMLEKSAKGTLTDAELILLQSLDLAMLSRYEQAKNLTITLLKKWLVEYKFKDWTLHSSNPDKLNQPVTNEEKQERAQDIATKLSDNKLWHSHGRMIGAATLTRILKLKIEDYSTDKPLRGKLLAYSDFLTDYITRNDLKFFLHSRCYF